METPELQLRSKIQRRGCRVKPGEGSRLLLAVMGCGGMFAGAASYGQVQNSLAGESAAEALKRSMAAGGYDLRYGPVRLKADATLGVNYTDNVFYSHDAKDDVMINPEITLGALWPITQLNALKLSLDLSYEWYLKNHALNSDAPLINPGSELVFNLFVGDFRIRLHERFSYQESLFYNSLSGENVQFFNFNNVGTFSRFDNETGFDVDWDLNKVVLSAGYNHENFISKTGSFDYLNRASEWFTASAAFSLGDQAQTGLEAQASLHSYDQETILNDNWRTRVGPFIELKLREKVTLRAGGGYDTARYDAAALGNSDYENYYCYGRIRQDTRLFSHSLTGGREHLLGDNANNMTTTYARYSISSPAIAHLELEAHLSINVAEEFGGAFDEKFTYYGAGFRAESQIQKHLRANLSYEFRQKESDLALRDFDRNRVTVSVTYTL
jgi:hypothetical protein